MIFRRQSWFWCALAVVFVIMIVRYSQVAARRHYSDFRVYHAAARAFAEKKDLYRFEDARLTPYKYSPFFAMMISPMGALPIAWAACLFYAINFAAMIAFIAVASRLIERSGGGRVGNGRVWLWIPVVFSARFLMGILDAGQVNLILMLLVIGALACAEGRRPVLAGALLAASVMLKYVSILFVPYFLLRKKIAAAMLTLVWCGLFALLPAVAVGWDRQTQYLKAWIPSIAHNSFDRGSWTDYKNQSLASLVARSTLRSSPYENEWPSLKLFEIGGSLATAGVISAALYGIILLRTKKDADQASQGAMIDYALLFLCMALFNANAWPFNFAVFLFSAMVGADLWRRRSSLRRPLTGAIFALSFLLANIGSESLVGDAWQRRTEVYSFLTLATLGMFGLLAKAKFQAAEL